MTTGGWRRQVAAWGLVVFAAFAAITLRDSVQAQDQCPIPPAVKQVEAQAIYSDPAGSQLDVSGLRRNQQLIQPLRAFTDGLTRRVDDDDAGSTQAALRCAATMLRNWASAGALLQEPASFPAVRQRQRFVLGITLAALKLRALGSTLDGAAVGWLHALGTAVMQEFKRRRIVDNLGVWSAANAASLALLDGDPGALRYESEMWQQGLRQIGQGGLLATELRRQSRALLYHQYYASALLVLRRLRSALGQKPTAQNEADLRRLVERVEADLCDPDAMASAAGGYPQEKPPAANFAVGLVFGSDMIDDRWTRCGTKPRELRDVTLGGQLDRTFALLPRVTDALRR